MFPFRSIKFNFDTELFKSTKEKAELVRDFLMDSQTFKDYGIISILWGISEYEWEHR